MLDAAETREDALLDGRVRLLQPRRGHRAGTDAVLLAAAASPEKDEVVADLGSASGAVGLIIAARRPGCRILFVERDGRLADLCRRNLVLNGIEQRGRVIIADLLGSSAERRAAGLLPNSCDWVVTNPPFLDAVSARPSPDLARAAAHHMPPDGLSAWLKSAVDLLKPGGRIALIHRADRLQECLAAMTACGGLNVTPVYGRAGSPAIRVILSGVKGSRAAMTLWTPLVLHEGAGQFTPRAEALHRGNLDLV